MALQKHAFRVPSKEDEAEVGHAKKWADSISEWTGLSFTEATRAAADREGWRRLAREAASSRRAPTALVGVFWRNEMKLYF